MMTLTSAPLFGSSLCFLLVIQSAFAAANNSSKDTAKSANPSGKAAKASKRFSDLPKAPAVDLDHGQFTVAGLTNQLDPAWLKPPTNLYQLGPGDSLEIEILGDVGSRAFANLGPDGKIYYSLLPGLMVWGKTLSQTRDLIQDGLKKYMREPPDVAVTLRTSGSQNVWILGNVQAPGLYPLNRPMTLLDVITSAGGTIPMPGAVDGICDLKRSFVMRDGLPVAVDFEKLLREGDLSQNVYLRPNDLVCLRSAARQSVYVMGAVAMPNVVTFSDQMTLLGAITTCGGPIEYAYITKVAVIRGSLVNPQVAEIDFKEIMRGKAPNVKLEPGDIVYVPYVPWRRLAMFAEQVLRQFVYTVASNEGYRATVPGAKPLTPTIPFGYSAPPP
jgi:polysaccharide export outer membrane protein